MPDAEATQPAGERETLLLRYVRLALEQRERGDAVDLTQLCAPHPALAGPVADALGIGAAIEGMKSEARLRDTLEGLLLAERYELRRRIGAGAAGVVYEARDRQLQRTVAVKILQSRLLAEDDAEARFVREGQALAALRHPHVVPVYDQGRSADGVCFLVMEYLEGASLASVLRAHAERCAGRAQPSAFVGAAWLDASLGIAAAPADSYLRLVVGWVADVAAALQQAHAIGVLHRDVKPSNIFVTGDGRAVLLDFGLAKRAEDAALTASGVALGTPYYMAPEQVEARAIDARTDVYGLSATLYHLLALQPPYSGDVAEVLVQLRTADPVPAAVRHPGLPRDLVAILDHGLERDARRRYPTAAALEADLRAFLTHQPVSVRPQTRVQRTWRRLRRHPARLVSAVAVVVALALLVVVVPLWRAVDRQQLTAQKRQLMRGLPARLAIEGRVEERLLVPLAEREATLATIDAILAIDGDDLAIRMFRAALRLDNGDHAGAAADLERVAESAASAYMRAVAQRYAAANRARQGTAAVDLDALGVAPQSPQDWFVAGFHELRNRHRDGFAARAKAALDRAADDFLPARDLRLLALLAVAERQPTRAAKQRAYLAAHDEARTLEGVYGQPTARTRSTIGTALLGMERYRDALEPLHDSLQLRAGRHGPLHNLGVAHQRLGDLEGAIGWFRRAREVRPWFWNTIYHLAWLHAQRSEFELADAAAATLTPESLGDQAWRGPYLRGLIELRRAVEAKAAGDTETARRAAATGATEFRAAAHSTELQPLRDLANLHRRILVALRRNDQEQMFQSFAVALARTDPTNPYMIDSLAKMVPEAGLSPAAVADLKAFFRRQVQAMQPGDPGLRRP